MKELGKSGIQVYFVSCSLNWCKAGSFDVLRQQADFILDNVPEAYLILRISLDPPAQWLKEHPEEAVMWNNGEPLKPQASSVAKEYASIGMYYSLASARWRQDGGRAILEFIDQVERADFGRRVIGFLLTAGGTGEWYYPAGVSPIRDELYTGNSPAFKSDFTRILKETYGTLDRLRTSWNDPQATFKNPRIPDLDDRVFAAIDGRYFSSEVNEILMFYLDDPDKHITPLKNTSNIGSFLNPDTHQFVADYYRAWNYATADSIIHFGRVIKERTQNSKIVGAFTGYPEAGVLRMLDSGYVDFLASPGNYDNREPGGVTALRGMQDSFRIRNRIFMVEDDTRTHLSDESYKYFTGTHTLGDSLTVMKRDFARNLSEDLQAWWFDMGQGGWYDDPKILALIKRQQELAQKAYEFDRSATPEIALIYDVDSTWYTSGRTTSDFCYMLRNFEVHRIGAPVAYHFHDDFNLDNMPEYKLYVFLNTFVLSDKDREAIDTTVKKNSRTVLWLYSPGIINPDRSPRFSIDHVTELTDIKVASRDITARPLCRVVDDGGGILAGVPTDKDYGYFDRQKTGRNAVQPDGPARCTFLNPFIYGDDPEVTVMARFAGNDMPAIVAREFGSWRSVYAFFKAVHSDIIRAVASYAGCHIYSESDDILYANQHFVTLHASTSGGKTIKLPKVSNPFEVYEHRFYGNNTRQIQFTSEKGETKTFYLHGEI